MWGLAFPMFLVVTFCLALLVTEWDWASTQVEGRWIWLPAGIGGGLVAIMFVIAGFIAPPSNSN
jgi:hypothetical protein